jgi:Flp pilus assembly protein TadG
MRAALDGAFAILFCAIILPPLLCLSLLYYFATYLLHRILR